MRIAAWVCAGIPRRRPCADGPSSRRHRLVQRGRKLPVVAVRARTALHRGECATYDVGQGIPVAVRARTALHRGDWNGGTVAGWTGESPSVRGRPFTEAPRYGDLELMPARSPS